MTKVYFIEKDQDFFFSYKEQRNFVRESKEVETLIIDFASPAPVEGIEKEPYLGVLINNRLERITHKGKEVIITETNDYKFSSLSFTPAATEFIQRNSEDAPSWFAEKGRLTLKDLFF